MPRWLFRLAGRIGRFISGGPQRSFPIPKGIALPSPEPPVLAAKAPTVTNPWRKAKEEQADARQGGYDPYRKKKAAPKAQTEYFMAVSGRGASRVHFNGEHPVAAEQALREAHQYRTRTREFLKAMTTALLQAREHDAAKTKVGAKVEFSGGIARVTRTPKK